MKYKLLKDLYDCFYTPPELSAQKQEIEECHRALGGVLGKSERRLVLQIIDAKDRIAMCHTAVHKAIQAAIMVAMTNFFISLPP